MIANYHTHTWRCMHASGTEREYIEKAIEGGMEILGFSDHTPMPYSDGYVSNVKMTLNQLEDYVNTILRLKNEYQKDIKIYLGLEVEYYPRYFHSLLEITGQYPIEYFLLAQHYLGNEINDFFSGTPHDNPEYLIRYCRQSAEALETGCFTYFAHPDFINFTGDKKTYGQWMGWLCSCAKKLDIPLEINFQGIWSKRNYPNPAFWEIAGSVGNKVIFGCDAHWPERVWDTETLSIAEKLVNRYDLELIDTVALHTPAQGGSIVKNRFLP